MKIRNYKITKEDYDALDVMTVGERNRHLEDCVLNEYITCGLGFYGCIGLKIENNKFYAIIETGNTCD